MGFPAAGSSTEVPRLPLRNLSITAQLAAIVLVFSAIVAALLLVVMVSFGISTGVRAFITGESLWTKGQKNAVYHLARYARAQDPQDYLKFAEAIRVPLGDRQARLELLKPDYDYARVKQGFIQGGNNPQDIPYLTFLVRGFRGLSYLEEALVIWREGDVRIEQLLRCGAELHAAIGSGQLTAQRAAELEARIEQLNAELTPLEQQFSATLGEAARWVGGVLIATILAVAALLLSGGLLLTWRISSGLRSEILGIRRGVLRVAQGDLEQPIAVQSRDELGELAQAFNTMVAQRRATEQALTASTALASSIVATAYDAYVAMNERGLVLDWNSQAERTFGYSQAAAMGQPLAELIIPERYRQAHREGLRRYLDTGEARVLNQRIEITAQHALGHEFPVELTIWASADGSGQRFNAFLHDISERQRTLQRLEAQKSAAAVLVEAATLDDAAPGVLRAICEALNWDFGALWILDAEETVLRCADLYSRAGVEVPHFAAATRSLRFKPGSGLPGRIWAGGLPTWIEDVTLDGNFPRAPAALQDDLHGAFGFPIYSGSQVLGVVEFFSHAIQSPDEQLLRMMGTIGNLLGQFMGRKRAETALEKEREFLNVLLENLAEGIVACDEHGVLWIFNRATRNFHGLPEQPLPPERWAEHYDLYEADGTTRLSTERIPLFRAFKGEPVRNVEIVIAPKGRPAHTVLCNGQPLITPSGRKLGAVVVMHDITERKHAEAELAARADELARSNTELERFAYVASHDLQEPLRTVTSYTQLLARCYGPHLGREEQDFVGYITDAVQRMRELIDGLLSYSRVARADEPSQSVALGGLVDTALANLKEAIDSSGARITVRPLPTLRVDAPQFTQLFQNLIGNAIKFRGKEPPQIEVRARLENGYWRFSVCDNGIGIDPAYAERIFALFQRLHTPEHYAGSGIGLAICKRIVERHGGRIWVEPANPGSVFHFTLPA